MAAFPSRTALTVAVALLGVAADVASAETDPAAPSLRAPELVDFVEAGYPPAALEARREARVVLELVLDVEGRVTAAKVVEPAGFGFDEAALAAVASFRFTPAMRGDTPVRSRIHYAYEFRLPAPPVAPAAAGERSAPDAVPPQADDAPIDVVVRGASEAERLRGSAQAVHVIETEEAQRQTADLGEVLARSQGVGVRRAGGLGSATRFSLDGLTDDQIRFFLDGLPLELSGYPFGIANVPVNLVERVEVYRGVVPIRFGADALGGAVNLVSESSARARDASVSWQAGSFGTQRLAASGQSRSAATGLFARVSGFLDRADNDYPIDVEVADAAGHLSPARVRRVHDGYRAAGVNVELGVVDRSWARRLVLRAFATGYDKELPHNLVMTVPYGAVEYGERTAGATLRYAQAVGRLSLELAGGYTYGETRFQDVSTCVYDWYGQCIRERRQPGEIESRPRDQVTWEHAAFARLDAGWRAGDGQVVRLSLSPTFTTRTGDERRQADPTARDALSAQRDLLGVVSGVEWELDLLGDRLENVAFAKGYLQLARSEEPLPGGVFAERSTDTYRVGLGDALRYRLSGWITAKASWEWATRLPRPDELFGDALLVTENLGLRPETSHNVNLGATLDAGGTRAGAWLLDVNAFLRDADELIVLLGNDRVFRYENVYAARSVGVEAAGGWTAPREWLGLAASVTVQDFRNTSGEGTFGAFAGDRIPNRPWLLASASARLQRRGVATRGDELSLMWNGRYVHEFYRGWESVGVRELKQTVPSQLLHGVALGYLVRRPRLELGFTAEVQNLTDAAAFDFYGVQRPGRAFHLKTTAQF